jgi:hypothetical protein
MSEDSWPKVGASFGIVAAILLILTFVLGPTDSPPGFNDTAAEVSAYIQDHHGELQTVVALSFAALTAFLWFLGSVFFRLRAAESSARLSATALAGGIALAVGGVIGTAAQGAAVYHAGVLGPDVVLAVWDVSLFGYLFFLVGLAVLAGATGILALRAGALPSLLGGYSLLTGLYAFVVGLVASFSETGAFSPSDGALGLIAFLLFVVWLLAVGGTLVKEPRGTEGTTQAP